MHVHLPDARLRTYQQFARASSMAAVAVPIAWGIAEGCEVMDRSLYQCWKNDPCKLNSFNETGSNSMFWFSKFW